MYIFRSGHFQQIFHFLPSLIRIFWLASRHRRHISINWCVSCCKWSGEFVIAAIFGDEVLAVGSILIIPNSSSTVLCGRTAGNFSGSDVDEVVVDVDVSSWKSSFLIARRKLIFRLRRTLLIILPTIGSPVLQRDDDSTLNINEYWWFLSYSFFAVIFHRVVIYLKLLICQLKRYQKIVDRRNWENGWVLWLRWHPVESHLYLSIYCLLSSNYTQKSQIYPIPHLRWQLQEHRTQTRLIWANVVWQLSFFADSRRFR